METVKIVFYVFFMFFLVVGIHEWGHYYFAKRAGILVREFAIGFGPKMFSYKKNETQFTFRLLPFGGYARMAGEDPDLLEIETGQIINVRIADGQVKKLYTDNLQKQRNVIQGEVLCIELEEKLIIKLDIDGEQITYPVHPRAMIVSKGRETQIAPKDRQYGSKTVGQRAMAIFAGPLMNFILAFFLFVIFVQMNGVQVVNPTYIKIGEVTSNSPAFQVGLKKEISLIKLMVSRSVQTNKKRLL